MENAIGAEAAAIGEGTFVDALEVGGTLAEIQGITKEMGDVIGALAEAELDAGRVEAARAILEGLVVTNHLDAGAWALLSRAHRRLGQPLAARFCAEVAARLAPADPAVRLARAEALLLSAGDRDAGRAELSRLAGDARVGARAIALLAALGT
jgi:thioredoxin-like negative regulator of GroEL